MTDRKLTVSEVEEALEDGLIHNISIYYIGPDGNRIILQEPQIVMGGNGSVTFSSGDISVEKFVGLDTEDVNGEEVFKDVFVLQEQPSQLPLQGGRKSRRKVTRKSRKTSRKRSRKSNRKTSRKGKKSRRY